MSESGGELSSVPHPPFLFAGLRCALEMALVASLILLLGLPARNPVALAVVVLLAFAAMVVVLFWCLNQQMDRWIKHARGKPTVQ
ncbi:hypothetical protein IL252_00690 [Halomicrobium sp. IBSBa]|uniref:hypothetical protein n=1 Tax=Halomicrobium sp. IBSBa TaxID=2778916 RepID=UPI001ABFA830|nr:hypothetical protein [Halomicrobium sp. IBSBa]MBO4246331.1 hypothetical protein [Halomicrobium sp. IBSBa]